MIEGADQSALRVRMEFSAADFFRVLMLTPAKIDVECDPIVGRTHFVKDGRVVAVARPIPAESLR